MERCSKLLKHEAAKTIIGVKVAFDWFNDFRIREF